MRHQTRIRNIVLMLALSLIPCSMSTSQTQEGDLMNRAWKAWWITHPDGPQREFGVFHFRKTFTLESVPQRFVIHVSGDNRYELFVNGERVLAGPARGDLNHWRYETLDIASAPRSRPERAGGSRVELRRTGSHGADDQRNRLDRSRRQQRGRDREHGCFLESL